MAGIAEYSYFKAQGRSHVACETADKAERYLADLRRNLKNDYRADEILTSTREGRFRVLAFVFDGAAPQGWVPAPGLTPSDGMKAMMPAPGSRDDFRIVTQCGLADRAVRNRRLEDVLGCPDFPSRPCAAGYFSNRFVRDVTCYAPWQEGAATMPPVPSRHGRLAQPAVMALGSSRPQAGGGSDPLQHMKLNGDYYIRVPNDGRGRPLFVPPDAALMDYETMLGLDELEYAFKYGRVPPARRRPPGP